MCRLHINVRQILSLSAHNRICLLAIIIAWNQLISCTHHESIPTLNGSAIPNDNAFNSSHTPERLNAQRITKSNYNIPVNIQFKPAHYLHDKNYIATNVDFVAKAEILDDKFKNLAIEYQWSVKNKTIVTNPNASQITYKFTEADDDEFLNLLVFHHPNDTGVIKKNLVIRDPIVVQEPKGKTFLEHGELLDITLPISSGTKPIMYCINFCRIGNDNKASGSDCNECTPDMVVSKDQVHIRFYLRKVGNYTLNFVTDNIVSHVVKTYSVKITDTIRPETVPFVPIVSSIVAVIIVLSGLALHMKFKRTLMTETADFDFIRHDYNDEDDFWDDEEYTFFQRVRYLLFKVDRDHDTSVSDSFLSAAGSRF